MAYRYIGKYKDSKGKTRYSQRTTKDSEYAHALMGNFQNEELWLFEPKFKRKLILLEKRVDGKMLSVKDLEKYRKKVK